MPSFLDIHTTSQADLRHMIDSARSMKAARGAVPKATPAQREMATA